MPPANESSGTVRYWRKVSFAVMEGWLELLLVAPLLVFVLSNMFTGSPPLVEFLPILPVYTVAAALIAALPKLYWYRVGELAAVLFSFWWSGLLFEGPYINRALSFGIGLVLSLRAIRLVRLGTSALLPSFSYWFGFAACLPIGWLMRRSPEMSYDAGLIPVIALMLLAAAIFQSNRYSLWSAAYAGVEPRNGGSRYADRKLRMINLVLATGFGGFVLLVSMWSLVDSWLSRIAHMLYGLVAALLEWLGRKKPREEVMTPPAPDYNQGPIMEEPYKEPSLFWVWLERIFMFLFLVVVVVMVFYLLRFMLRFIPAWIRKLGLWLAKRREDQQEDHDYTDEISSTKDPSGDPKEGLLDRMWRLFRPDRPVQWEDLQDNRERARFLYVTALRKARGVGWDWQSSWTPRELGEKAKESGTPSRWLDPEVCGIYDETRYGGKVPTDQQLAKWRTQLEEGKGS